MRKKRNIRKTIKQKGGFFGIFSKKPPTLTPEAQLKKDALAVLKNNGITDLNEFLHGKQFVFNDKDKKYNDVIIGDYTFQLTRDMSRTFTLLVFKTSNPTFNVKLHSFNDY